MSSRIILSHIIAGDINLTGDGTPYDGSGTPATGATSPYELSANDDTGGVWSATAAPPALVLSGGPPFRLGSDVTLRGYGVVEETVGVQMRGTTFNNAVALLRRLQHILSAGATHRLPQLKLSYDQTGTSTVYEILAASVQVLPSSVNQEIESGMLRALITWTRAPVGGNVGASGSATLINAVSIGNNGTGSPDNVESLGSSGIGDMIYEGAPLNLTLTGTLGSSPDYLLATVAGRAYTANTSSLVTSSTLEGAASLSMSNLSSYGYDYQRLRARIVARVSDASANLQIRGRIRNAAGYVFHTTPWVTSPSAGSGTTKLFDLGAWNPQPLAADAGSLLLVMPLVLAIDARSTDGAATTGAMVSAELVHYWTFCEVTPAVDIGSDSLRIVGTTENNNAVAVPKVPRAHIVNTSAYGAACIIRGRPPVYVPDALLWIATRNGLTWATTTGATYTLTATYSPLYHTLRGGQV